MSTSEGQAIIWKGSFSYDPEEYGFEELVNFEMYVTLINGHFEGVSYDDEFRDLYPELPKVVGTIEGNQIHFVVTYPVSYSINENDEVAIDEGRKGHEVIYTGTFQKDTNRWAGIWEIMADEETDGDDIIYTDYSSGEWEMS
jgi:hypothetical protein